MKVLIKNANLISMSETREQLEKNIDILINDDNIEKIGKDIEFTGDMKLIDATDKVVMPGLVNAHAHIPMSIFRNN